jgi:hypothetical protein
MFKIVHTYTGDIYSGEVTVEVSGFSTIEGAIASAEERCLGLGGSYVVVLA